MVDRAGDTHEAGGVDGDDDHSTCYALLPDLFLLRATLKPSEFSWIGTPDECDEWQRLLDEYEEHQHGSNLPEHSDRYLAPAKELSFSVVILGTKDVASNGVNSTARPPLPRVTLNVHAPLTSPHETPRRPQLVLSAPALQAASCPAPAPAAMIAGSPESSAAHWLQQLQWQLETWWRELKGEENQLFDLYTHLAAWIADHHIPMEKLPFSNPTDHSLPSYPLAEPSEGAIHSHRPRRRCLRPWGVQMHRQIFYTHHLLSQVKQRELAAWSAELGVWLLVKLGYPGFLVLEGPKHSWEQSLLAAPPGQPGASASACAGVGIGGGALEMSRRIKGMQWAKLSARTEVDWVHTAAPPSSSSSQRRDQDEGDGDEADMEEGALLACPLARACVPGAGASGGREGARGKLRTCMRKTETLKEIVELMRMVGIPEDELVDGLSLRVGSGR
ncbi:hypothetical protein K437DRAFT_255893 [Tilletiaria anomala UBC 951]|uniref:Uncharacterized protein n=1 Tax=Tilletiaria anomala (strain ATCC 24038 / CBS 436.72 / UBC 951) TaxID=1037660 RepID=A0A066W9D6_TILAU|nr:uncharacterized protein K437DRAFT_255893 [Tilletiaria anomala UBC 951]KDN47350.1 hypothetical protein K437DRAFT_255893 [Tilletiaria anomala UBC 951]